MPWMDMELRFDGRHQIIAPVVRAEARHKREHENEKLQKWRLPVVCKIYDMTADSRSRLKPDEEIAIYSRLHDIQGHFIPQLYAAGTHWGMLRILVLEDCGASARDIVRNPDLHLPESFWLQAQRALKALHSRSILHGDLRMSNIAVSGREVRLIDLGESLEAPKNRREATIAYRNELKELEEMQREHEGIK
ncbi:hypothetical protein TWF696_006433 [Orbilia brochopaga]|uniref:Protein kinase domain-containing protein n=1 Tax=Orbilia brochopaga TaxID=3140254 RepID=A0AAV9UYP3_9PEZI